MKQGLLKNVWYMGLLSRQLKQNATYSMEIMGEPVVFWRSADGKVNAVRDICPHRGIPLSYGQIVKNEIECPYHGWKFNGKGVCTEIPSLAEGQDLDCSKIKVRSFPVEEKQGNIWIFFGDKDFDFTKAPPVPMLGAFSVDKAANHVEIAEFPCHIDHAVIGLMDPAHGPYIHKSWFWRSKKSVYEKRKKFAPVNFGFQMVRHEPSKNSKAYKLLGGQPTTEITFSLPSVRVEHVQVGRRSLYSFTALTPVNDSKTIIHQMLYWDMPWLTLAKPIVKKFTHAFLHQDIDAVSKQQHGLKYDPTLMLIRDADTQAKWYFNLKEEWNKVLTDGKSFENPVKETELRWRS